MTEPQVERRRVKRERVIKGGRLVFGFGGSTVACRILNESPFGLLAETESMTELPDQLAVKLDDGAIFHAVRRWALGNQIGLERVGEQMTDEATHTRMRSILDILERHGLDAAMGILRADRFFGDASLREAAEAADEAVARLKTVLQGAAAV
jgi:hypothetical protein